MSQREAHLLKEQQAKDKKKELKGVEDYNRLTGQNIKVIS